MHPDQELNLQLRYLHNLSMYPDWESNPQAFGVEDDAPTNWATPARAHYFFNVEELWYSISHFPP